jgi:potassium intermediate/small conductance calcium-activated channel subfamily N protein 2
VGYGDYYPKTMLGRAVIVATSLYGTIITAILVVIVISQCEFNGPEGNAYIVLKRLQCRDVIKDKAKVILRMCVSKTPMESGPIRHTFRLPKNAGLADLLYEIEEFKDLRREYR